MVNHDTLAPMDGIPAHDPATVDELLAAAARTVHEALPGLAEVMAEFGDTHQIEMTPDCVVAVRRPTPTLQEITTGRTVEQLLAKLRAERDGTDGS
jgi:hypothetical protein